MENKEFKPEEINGNEIIDFLNKESRDNDKLCDISISANSFVFESQRVDGNSYKLCFTGSYNNWGTLQAISGNSITIDNKGVRISLDEPFDGDGTDEALEEVLTEWLKTHMFDTNTEEKFYNILKDVYEKISVLSYTDKSEMLNIIDQLILAKTYMK
jgi:hypothetical protein